MLFGKKMVEIVHELFDKYVHEGDSVIDATMGTGQDTLKLCQCVGSEGRVYAFDIQQEALEQTRILLKNNHVDAQAHLICDSHANISEYVHEDVAAFVFNLGYLPNGDSSIVTKSDTTIQALKACLERLKTGGIGVVLAYWGHPGGADEKNCVDKLLSDLKPKKYDVLKLENHNRAHTPPVLYMLLKH